MAEAAAALPVFVLGGFGNGFALVHDRLLLGDAVPEALHGRVFALPKAVTSLAFGRLRPQPVERGLQALSLVGCGP